MIQETPTDPAWDQLAPLLDDAMAQLREQDREALVLRYFQNRNLREVGAAFGVDEYAAQKRVGRALEKLRAIFVKRGAVSTSAVIAGALSAHSVQAAPAALVKAVTAIAVAKGAAAGGSTLLLMEGTLKVAAYAKLKLAVGVTAGILLAGGAVTVVLSGNRAGNPRSAGEIFNKAQAQYAALASYSDQGSTAASLNGATNTTTFTTKLGRPSFYRIEWEPFNEAAIPAVNPQAVWSAGAGDFIWLGMGRPNRTIREVALGGAPGILENRTTIIPRTFFGMDLSFQLGGLMSGGKRQADEKVDGVDCYVLARESDGTRKTLWIGKRDYLIRQVQTAPSANAMTAKLVKPSPAMVASLARTRFPGLTLMEKHLNIVTNESFSKEDFEHQTPAPIPN